jgi:hypothetical protein
MTDDPTRAGDPTRALPKTLPRRRLFGLAGASAVGAAGVGLVACSSDNSAGPTLVTAAADSSSGPPFVSRPDLTPPRITIRRHGAPIDPRYIFLNAPYSGPGHGGTYILDHRGHFVWFGPNTAAQHRMNFNVQTFKGEPVLTWFRGLVVQGYGKGELVIADSLQDPARHPAGARRACGLPRFLRDRAGHGADHDLPHALRHRPD